MTLELPPHSNSAKKKVYNAQYGKLKKMQQYLESAEFGQTISQIAEDLKLSRNTVKNYLEILQNEGSAYYREIGPAKIWFSRKTRESDPESRIPGFLRSFLMETLGSFERLNQSSTDELNALFQEIGREVGKKVAWPGEVDFRNPTIVHPRMPELKQFIEQFISIIEDTGVFLKAELVPAVGDDYAPLLIRATFHNQRWGQFKLYYFLMAGFFESKLRSVYGNALYLTVREIQCDGQWCYYELGIKDMKNEEERSDGN